MSRVGKQLIKFDDKVSITTSGREVTVKGPKGELSWALPEGIDLTVDDGQCAVERSDASRQGGANHGLARSLLQGFVIGVSAGFKKELEIQGIGYRGQCSGQKLTMNLGYSHPVEYVAPDGVQLSMPDNTHIVVEGIDKQKVGQTAATIRGFRPPDSYKGKGIRYVGEFVALKEGKTVG